MAYRRLMKLMGVIAALAMLAAACGDDGAEPAPSAGEPAAEPSGEPAGETVAELAAEPSGETVAEPAAEPSAEAAAEPSGEPSGEPVAEPAQEPAPQISTTFVDLLSSVPETISPETRTSISLNQIPSWTAGLVRDRGSDPGETLFPSSDEVDPFLAESWVRDDNGNLVFTLRDDVVSRAGNPLTADDVLWTFQRANAIYPGISTFHSLAGIDPEDPLTVLNERQVRVNLTFDSKWTLAYLAHIAYGIWDRTVLEEYATDEDPWASNWLSTTATAGFGPYDVTDFAPGEQITLTANPNWPDPLYFETVILRAVSDASTRVQAVLAGDAQHTNGLSWPLFDDAVKRSATEPVEAYTVLANSVLEFGVVHNVEPFGDPRVRRALSLAIDRQAIIDSVFAGYGAPALYQVHSGLANLPDDLPKFEYDPNRAQELLAEAGAENLEFTFTASPASTGSYTEDLLALIQAQLGAVGVKMNIEIIASPGEFFGRIVGFQIQGRLGSNPLTLADVAQNIVHALTQRFSASTFMVYEDAALKEKAAELVTTPPGPASDAIISEILFTIAEDIPFVMLVEVPNQVVTQAGIAGYRGYVIPQMYYDLLAPAT